MLKVALRSPQQCDPPGKIQLQWQQPSTPGSDFVYRLETPIGTGSFNGALFKDLFMEHARLDKSHFFNFLQKAGPADLNLDASPFAQHIYRSFCESQNEKLGVTASGAQTALSRIQAISDVFRAAVGSKGEVRGAESFGKLFPQMVRAIEERKGQQERKGIGALFEGWFKTHTIEEAFLRYDTNADGAIDENECVAMGLMLILFYDIYVGTGEERLGLHRDEYGAALVKLGFADITRLFSGVFLDQVFDRLDEDKCGSVDLPEFVVGVGRLLRPITWSRQLQSFPTWPGHSAFGNGGKPDGVVDLLKTLHTGDVILMRCDDAMGRFLQFALDSPWNHLAVVVRHAARPGIANENTEKYLQSFPFRRKSHHHCSPGYCRCFDGSWDLEYGPSYISQLSGLGVSLLESTGEGIHVYDFAHRVFESNYAKCHSVVAVRRLQGVDNKEDTPRIEKFIHGVRGRLYTTKPDEMKQAISRQNSGGSDDTESYFCSKVVSAFYKHMGWLPEDSPIVSMPCDWGDDPSPHANPVQLAQGSLGPVEIIHSDFIPGVERPWKAPKKK